MFIVIGTMIGGIVAGYLLRRVRGLTFLKKLPTLFIFLLLFSLGITVGSNKLIINNLSTIGLNALLISVGALAGSLLLSTLLYRKYFKKEEE